MTTKPESRLKGLEKERLDIIVIGGGVIGSGIANDAAGRGLRVALFEKDDYASGTSSRATRLVHGGLRYLEMLDFGLVRQDLKEREILLRNAPHLVNPLPFLVPMYERSLFYQVKLRIGMVLYDLLSYDKSLPNHKFYNAAETLQKEPSLKAEGLKGSFIYYDGQVPLTERLVMENIIAAQQKGARCFNHSKVIKALYEGKNVTGVLVEDELSGQQIEVKARLVVNVAGPWLDPLEEKLTGNKSHKVRKTKGIHFTAPSTTNNALVLFAQKDDRLFFVIPWLGYAWVGTTDTDFDEDLDSVRATREDVEYLVDSVREVFPKSDWETIYFTNAGVRALVRKETKAGEDESEVSRKHAVVDQEKKNGITGMISVVGGKLTAYRGIAEEATDFALKKLNLGSKTHTAKEKLPGARFEGSFDQFTNRMVEEGTTYGLNESQIKNLTRLYGSRISEIFELVKANPFLTRPIHPAYPDILAQLKHAVEHEQCLDVCDFMMRRSALFFTPDQGRKAAQTISLELAQLLQWDETQRQQAEADYAQELAWTQEWKVGQSLSTK